MQSPKFQFLQSDIEDVFGIDLLNEEFRRRIKTQTVLPCPETVPMLVPRISARSELSSKQRGSKAGISCRP